MLPKMSLTQGVDFLNITKAGLKKKLKRENITLPKYGKNNSRYYIDHEVAKKIFKNKIEKKIISMTLVKGGVGKTTLTKEIAIACSLYGAKVLCIDLDMQSNLTASFNKENDSLSSPVIADLIDESIHVSRSILNITSGLDLIPSRIDNAEIDAIIKYKNIDISKIYRNILSPVINDYDIIVFDCPPAFTETVACAVLASDLIICPVTPSEFSFTTGIETSFKLIDRAVSDTDKKVDKKILLNKFQKNRLKSLHTLNALMSNDKYKSIVFKGWVSNSQNFENVLGNKSNNIPSKSIFEISSIKKEQEEILHIAQEILEI